MEADSDFCIVAKHDPHHWLKDMPDADLFKIQDGYLVLEARGTWYSRCNRTTAQYNLSGINMPTLTGDEWRNSKISIADLRVWQEQNL